MKGVKICLAAVLLLGFMSCGQPEITGSWIQPIPGQTGNSQGFELKKGGEAHSINMYTLLYETWRKQDDKLILTGKSVGNARTIEFSDTLTIISLTKDNLVVDRDGLELYYKRQ